MLDLIFTILIFALVFVIGVRFAHFRWKLKIDNSYIAKSYNKLKCHNENCINNFNTFCVNKSICANHFFNE